MSDRIRSNLHELEKQTSRLGPSERTGTAHAERMLAAAEHRRQKELASRMNDRVRHYVGMNPNHAIERILAQEFSEEDRQQYLKGEDSAWRTLSPDLDRQVRAIREKITESQVHPRREDTFRGDQTYWEVEHSEYMDTVFREYPRLFSKFMERIKGESERLWRRRPVGAWVEKGLNLIKGL